jgi:hypothetical protein
MEREIETHKVNGLNEAIDITVMDEPGHGNACHVYSIVAIDPKHWQDQPDGTKVLDVEKTANERHGCVIKFQNGPIGEVGVNGISNEALLAVVRDRLDCFQSGKYACEANGVALRHIVNAMETLHERTRARMSRGVEGTHTV